MQKPKTQTSVLMMLALLVTAAGAGLLFYFAFSYDVTANGIIVNIYRLNQKNNGMMLGGILGGVGLIMITIVEVSRRKQ